MAIDSKDTWGFAEHPDPQRASCETPEDNVGEDELEFEQWAARNRVMHTRMSEEERFALRIAAALAKLKNGSLSMAATRRRSRDGRRAWCATSGRSQCRWRTWQPPHTLPYVCIRRQQQQWLRVLRAAQVEVAGFTPSSVTPVTESSLSIRVRPCTPPPTSQEHS